MSLAVSDYILLKGPDDIWYANQVSGVVETRAFPIPWLALETPEVPTDEVMSGSASAG